MRIRTTPVFLLLALIILPAVFMVGDMQGMSVQRAAYAALPTATPFIRIITHTRIVRQIVRVPVVDVRTVYRTRTVVQSVQTPLPMVSPPTLTPFAPPTVVPTSTPVMSVPLRKPLPPASGNDVSRAYQIDTGHTGTIARDRLRPPLRQVWAIDLGGTVSYPLIVGKLAYVTVEDPNSYGTKLYALNRSTGRTAWGPVELGGTYSWSGLTYDDGHIFALNHDGLLRSFDAVSGAAGWSRQMPGQYSFTSAPTARHGIVYTGGAGSGGTVYAVRATTGEILWTAEVMNGDDSSPAVSEGGVFVSYACQQDYAFAPRTGALLWHHVSACEGGGGKTPVFADGKLYARDMGGLILDGATGQEQGAFSSDTAPAVSATRVFYLAGSTLTAVDTRAQAVLWTFAEDGSLSSAPIVVGRCVYVGSSNGHLYALDARTGAMLSMATLPAGVEAPDEQNVRVLTGFGVGGGELLVPASQWLVAYVSQ